MQKILITGNGFDLHHKLPTSYNDFITILNKVNTLNSDLDSICYSDLFTEENDFYDTAKIVFDPKKINELKKQIQQNVWFNYFKEIHSIETWIDFEQEIENALQIVLEFIESIDNEVLTNKFRGVIVRIDFSNKFYKNYSVFNKLLLLNIYEELENNANHVKIKEIYCHKINDIVQKINKNLIFKNLYDELEKFIVIFNNYFTNIVTPFYNNYLNNNIPIKNSNSFINNQLLLGIDKVYTFNYTPTSEKFYGNKSHDYLHGKINNNSINQNIVLGISEISDNLKQLGQFSFTKYYQKLNKNTDYHFLQNIQKHFPLKIFVWGHSLDQSDSDYIKEIFDRISYNESKLIIFFHTENSKSIQLNNLFKILNKEIIEDYMKKGKLSFEKSDIENIHKTINVVF